MTITAKTRVCAVIGDPVGHSLSPQIHNSAFRALGLDFAYVAFPVKRGNVAEAVRAVRALGIRGLSVTIPHKVDILAHLDGVEEVARNTGSVNTVVNEGGRLFGTSTDGGGALRALAERGVSPAGRRCVLLGSGGAARALAFSLATLDPLPRLTILGVEPDELKGLAGDLARKTRLSPQAEDLRPATLDASLSDAEILIHATPIGMSPRVNESLVPAELLRPGLVVFDVVYTPLETRLLKDAAAAGATCVPGLGMFVHQAAIQFELWTGQKAPADVMTRTVSEALALAAGR
jgi:shikimate dehydrogenase